MSATGVGARELVQAWGRILSGHSPNLSIEITKECPLRCPGCYAYGDEHLGGEVTLRGLSDYKGDELVARFMALIDRFRPLHVSIVGGEPLVRYKELNQILPRMAERGIHTQLVTSAVRPIPSEWQRAEPVADRRVDRWPPARTRRAPHTRDLRAHPQAHRRASGHRSLHGDAATGAAGRLPPGVPRLLAGQPQHAPDLDQPLHAAGWRAVHGAPDQGGSRRR